MVSGSQPSGEGIRILVVDDNEELLALLEELLVILGYFPTCVRTAQAALAALAANRFDVALIDVWMGGAAGPDLARSIRKVRPDQPVIYMSGYGESGIEKVMSSEEIASVMHKPFNMMELKDRIEHLLAALAAA